MIMVRFSGRKRHRSYDRCSAFADVGTHSNERSAGHDQVAVIGCIDLPKGRFPILRTRTPNQ